MSIRLFNRSTRVVTLTPSGERYRHHALRILAAMDEAEREARNSQELAEGELRVTISEEISHLRIFEGIRIYRRQHLAVSIALTLASGIPDLYRGEADIALVNATSLPDSGQVARHLTTTFNVLCAAPRYLRGRQLPLCREDLAKHECLALDAAGCRPREWTLDDGNRSFRMRASSMLQTNSASILLNATLDGMGIGAPPLSTAVHRSQRGELIHILPGYRANVTNVYAMFASCRFMDARVRTWLMLFSAGSGHTVLPRVDDADVNLSLAIVIQAYGQRSLAATELLDVERRGSRHDARLLATVLDANAKVAALQENASALCSLEQMKRFETTQHRLEAALFRLLGASDRDPALAGNSRYRALKARLRAIELQIAASRQRYDDIASYYNARLSVLPLRFVPSMLTRRQRPVFAELEQPPLPPTLLHKTVLKGLHV